MSAGSAEGAPIGEEALRRAVTWVLLRTVWQSFDSGGESMRSRRSQALELGMGLVRPDEGVTLAAIDAFEHDPEAFARDARTWMQGEAAERAIAKDRADGLEPSECDAASVGWGAAAMRRLADKVDKEIRAQSDLLTRKARRG